MEILFFAVVLPLTFFILPMACFVACSVFLSRIRKIREENKKLEPKEQKSIVKDTVLFVVSLVMALSFIAFEILFIWSFNESVRHM